MIIMKKTLSLAWIAILILCIAGCSKSGGGTTPPPTVTPPTLTSASISAVTQTSATGGGTVTSAGNGTVTTRGVCWGTSANPTIANSTTLDGTGTGAFISAITGLTAGTTYHVRAYATNSAGTSYGSDMSFTTLS